MPKKSSAFKINGKTLSKASLNDLLSLSAEDIGRLTKKQSIQLEKRLYKAAKSRLDTIYKHGMRSIKAEYSFGAEYPEKPSNSASIYATKHRVTALKDFLESDKSTYSGIKKFYQKEELRIFGERGAGFKSEDERIRFWRAYDEFMHQNPQFYDQSTRVQQFIGRETFWRRGEFTAMDLNNILTNMMGNNEGVDIRADVGFELDI